MSHRFNRYHSKSLDQELIRKLKDQKNISLRKVKRSLLMNNSRYNNKNNNKDANEYVDNKDCFSERNLNSYNPPDNSGCDINRDACSLPSEKFLMMEKQLIPINEVALGMEYCDILDANGTRSLDISAYKLRLKHCKQLQLEAAVYFRTLSSSGQSQSIE